MSNLGEVSGTIHQVVAHADGSWPSPGGFTEIGLSVGMPTLTEVDLEYTSILIGGGFWVEVLSNAVPTGQQVPVQVAINCPDPGTPADWRVDVVGFEADLSAFITPPASPGLRLHVFGYYIVHPVYPAV